MAKVQNNFIKSKMNQDLDARLLPRNEYREAFNVQVSKSESDEVGSVENVLGNELVADIYNSTLIDNLKCIGYLEDEINSNVYLFLTNNSESRFRPENSVSSLILQSGGSNFFGDVENQPTTGGGGTGLTVNIQVNSDNEIQVISVNNPGSGYDVGGTISIASPFGSPAQATVEELAGQNLIGVFNSIDNSFKVLVKGAFLNFSTLNPIYGVNILEGLLFWTDNRNQPRKIAVDLANPNNLQNPTHYVTEDQMSVAKYNPYKPIDLWTESTLAPSSYETTMKDLVSKYYPNGGVSNYVSAVGNVITVSLIEGDITDPNGPYGLGATVGYVDSVTGVLTIIDGAQVSSTTFTDPNWEVTITGGTIPSFTVGDEIVFNPNPYYDVSFAGDPDYLEDKFVRFSYRFKFEDNEYSIFAPFTQVAFIPKQDGYFMYVNKVGVDEVDDQSAAYRSTVVSFVENKINDIKLNINLPFKKLEIQEKLKLSEIDVLYRESDEAAIKVVDTITLNDIEQSSTGDDYTYIYDYQSNKPIKTLPENELIRVYDKVPVRAFAQEISGNRIIYANYQDKHTPPEGLDYNVGVTRKLDFNLNITTATTTSGASNQSDLNIDNSTIITSIIPGFIVTTDSVGAIIPAQTKVVSFDNSVDPAPLVLSNNITIASSEDLIFTPESGVENTTSIIEYPEHSVKQNRNYQVGFVLSDRFGRQSSTILSNSFSTITINNVSYSGSTIYSPYIDNNTLANDFPGNSLKVLVNSVIGPENPNSNNGWPGIYNGDVESVNYNPLGWYSYKIVVKQTEQEYYNVYLPGIMAGYPQNGGDKIEIGRTSHAVLLNDNINKVPRDLAEVGPDQKQFRSSVQLFGRVQNSSTIITITPTSSNIGEANEQYYPGRLSDTVSTIANMNDLFGLNDPATPPPIGYEQFYLYESNPLISRISTPKKIGQLKTQEPTAGDEFNPERGIQYLAVYETEPVESALNIYWETSSVGLISELNNIILAGSGGAQGLLGFNFNNFDEKIRTGVEISSTDFRLVDSIGADIPAGDIQEFYIDSVYQGIGDDQNRVAGAGASDPYFELTNPGGGNNYNVVITQSFFDNVFVSFDENLYTFTFNFIAKINDVTTPIEFVNVELGNFPPTITSPPGDTTDVQAQSNSRDTIVTLEGINGSGNSQSLRWKDLEWNIDATNNLGDQVNIFKLDPNNANNTISYGYINSNFQNEVKLKPATSGDVPPGRYTVNVTLKDGKDQVSKTIVVNYGLDVQVNIVEASSQNCDYTVYYIEFLINNPPEGYENAYYWQLSDALAAPRPVTWDDFLEFNGDNSIIKINDTSAAAVTQTTCTLGSDGEATTRWFNQPISGCVQDRSEFDGSTCSSNDLEIETQLVNVTGYQFEFI